MDVSSLAVGQRTTTVMNIICLDSKGNQPWHLAQSHDRRGTKIWVRGKLPLGSMVAGAGLLVTSVTPVQLEVDERSFVVAVPPCTRSDLFRVIDLCCGLGGFSFAAAKVGFSVAMGVDQNGLWRKLFESLHEGACFCAGDLLDPSVLQELLSRGLFHGVVCSGIACQPHSILGDRKGMSDPRAQSLPRTLQVAWLMQAAILVLECTPEVLRDSQAQELLRQFTVATGFRMSQAILKLGNAWCGKRDRWIAVLTAPVVPVCNLLDLPSCTEVQVVRDLIPSFTAWHQFEQAQLTLNLYELSKYYQYAAGGMENVWVKLHEKLPTLLHSAGNQLYTCACGCRPALAESRLSQKGLVGVLIPLGTSQKHMHVEMHHARYLHPLEMWVLMGGHPEVCMGHNLRLAMAGVGQAVAPLMGVWIFAQVRRCLDLTLDQIPTAPEATLQVYMQEVIQACRLKWPLPATVAATVEDPIEEVGEESCHSLIMLSRPMTGQPDVQLKVSPNVTGAQLIAAENKLGTCTLDFRLCVDGEFADPNEPLQNMSLVSLVPSDWDPMQLRANPVVPCCLGIDDFLRHVRIAEAPEPGPVTDLSQLFMVRYPNMAQVERLSLLALQGPVWGDDEIVYGLESTATGTASDQNVNVWDPLLVTGLVQHDVPATWQRLVATLAPMCTVISAVLLGGHWIPLIWRVDTAGAVLHTVSVTLECEPVLEKLSRVFELCVGGAKGVWKPHSLGFVPEGFCGALAISFVRHLLWAWPMVADQEDLQLTAQTLRMDFANHLTDMCVRPMLAGLGVSTSGRLEDLLVQHGVAAAESSARANAAIKALGEPGIAKALDSANPWRELKWLGNQMRPPFMFVKPSELQSQIDRRAHEKPIGHKKHKQAKLAKGKGKGAGAPPLAVDPTSLRLEHGIFQSETGQPLSQLGLSQLGASVSGIVVVSVHAIDPYLKASNPISSGALGFFVVDLVQPPATHFRVDSVRIPLVCAVNSEPVLVDGHLIQLGAIPVQRAPLQKGSEVKAVPTCVVKAWVFRDQTSVAWQEVVAHPMLHVFSQVPPLLQCRDDECCGCECWHRTLDFPVDSPVLELWGKQWLKLDFRSAAPDDADVFTAHMRLPEHLQMQVQYFSGHDGVYLEPKSIDGRQPSPDFQVIWMPKADASQLMLQRQTVAHVVGLARLGHKMGLRCKTEHAAEVFSVLRPGQLFLPPGKRQTYLVGPFAYGTLQGSVAQVLHSNGWVAKPIQAVAARAHIQGLMYRVQSVQEPPCKVIRMAHGDVLIAKEEEADQPDRAVPKVQATSLTEAIVAKQVETDYMQVNDPWAKAASRLPPKATFQIGNPAEDMAQKVLSEVLAQLPKATMEVDSDDTTEKRVAALEVRLQDLQGQTNAMVASAQQQAQDTANQMMDLRTQVQQQGAHFEQAMASQASSMKGFQESVQEQFRQQVNHQQTMLDNMFNKQMAQFESLLTKRPRQE